MVQRGGLKDATKLAELDAAGADLNNYYNYYLEKALVGNEKILRSVGKVVEQLPGGPVSHSIMVIDMQNDFTWAHPQGAFSVADGINLVGSNGPLVKWLDANIDKCTKVVFSRDSHDCTHCSFLPRGGYYPPHCQRNSNGSQMHASMKKYAENPNVEVIFKGMDTDVESYGATQYPEDNYLKDRQSGCVTPPGKSCSDATGGFYIKNADNARISTKDAFADLPFHGAWTVETGIHSRFQIKDLFPGQTSGQHNIYVVGLAGDYCVQDTAINLAKAAKAVKQETGVRINVFVVQPLTRYVFVPMFVGAPEVTLDQIKSIAEAKPLNQYAFKFSPAINKVKILSKAEVEELKDTKDLLHFLNDPKTLVENFTAAGVYLLKDMPTIGEFAGGYRRKSQKKSKARKNRKSHRKDHRKSHRKDHRKH